MKHGTVGADAWLYKAPWGDHAPRRVRPFLKAWVRYPLMIWIHRRQRRRQGWSTYDMWNADAFIASAIVEVTRWIRTNGHTYPAMENITPELWDGILTRIGESLDAYNKESEDWGTMRVSKNAQTAMETFARYWQSMWD